MIFRLPAQGISIKKIIKTALNFLSAFILFGTGLCMASNLDSKLVHLPCDRTMPDMASGKYEFQYLPEYDYDLISKISRSDLNGSCRDAYPPQILPAFQAKIVSSGQKRITLAMPKMAPEVRFFLESLVKLGMSYYETDQFALVKDRAESGAGEMDSIPASGMYALALSAAQAENMVSRDEAVRILRKIYGTVNNDSVMPTQYGILPHFVRWKAGKYISLAEYSTVDTALYYHSMLLASEILGQSDIETGLENAIKKIDFKALTIQNGAGRGFISMGIDSDGKTIFKDKVWRHWGGESALVLLLARMSGQTPGFPVSCNPGEAGSSGNVFDGRGFIAEIQSLFYPQFDSAQPDRLTGQNWVGARRQLLHDQLQRTLEDFPGSKAAEDGLYGYSCGEAVGMCANNYCENGIKDGENRFIKPQPIIFPHYILMSSQASENPAAQLNKLELLEKKGLFSPWGLAESFDIELKKTDWMMGSLNASFEAISAYHLLGRITGKPDVIYASARRMALLKEAIGIFY